MYKSITIVPGLAGLLHVVSRDSDSYVEGNGNETLGGSTGSEDLNLLDKLMFRPLRRTTSSFGKES
ncbi:MAG: hypothetical protein OXE78_14330 [Gammaproteobacteria bacterium]|nr:hypothetical protein [Gammaproteobacteria bacterium]